MLVVYVHIGELCESLIVTVAPGSGSETLGTSWLCDPPNGIVIVVIDPAQTGALLFTDI